MIDAALIGLSPVLLALGAGLLHEYRARLALATRLLALERQQRWVGEVKHAEIAAGITALQARLAALEDGRGTVSPTTTAARAALGREAAEHVLGLENELRFHVNTKHGELEQGFRRLEAAVAALSPFGGH